MDYGFYAPLGVVRPFVRPVYRGWRYAYPFAKPLVARPLLAKPYVARPYVAKPVVAAPYLAKPVPYYGKAPVAYPVYYWEDEEEGEPE